jgi:hypothetical protein
MNHPLSRVGARVVLVAACTLCLVALFSVSSAPAHASQATAQPHASQANAQCLGIGGYPEDFSGYAGWSSDMTIAIGCGNDGSNTWSGEVWWGDGHTSTFYGSGINKTVTVSHIYSSPGTYHVKVQTISFHTACVCFGGICTCNTISYSSTNYATGTITRCIGPATFC